MGIPEPRSPRWGALAAILLVPLCLAATPSHAATPPLPIPGGTLRVSQRGAATVLDVTQHGRLASAALPTDKGIYAGSLDSIRLVGTMSGRVLVLLIDYSSRPGGALHMCSAGKETELSVVALRPTPHRTFHQRVASCWLLIFAET